MANHTSKQAGKMFTKLKIQNSKSNHHVKGFIIDHNGKKLFPPIFYSKGNKELPARVERNLCKALQINMDQFCELIECHMSREEYLKIRNSNDN